MKKVFNTIASRCVAREGEVDLIAVYKEDLGWPQTAYYIYEEESGRFYLNVDRTFSFSYEEVVYSDDFIVLGTTLEMSTYLNTKAVQQVVV